MSKKVAFLVAAEGVEQIELTEPWKAVTDAGHEAVLVSPRAGSVQLFNHLDKGDTHQVDLTVADARVGDFDALVLPGGVANPDALRQDQQAVALVKEFVAAGKPVAAICHAPWMLVEADVVGAAHHLVAEPQDGHPQRGWRLGRRDGRPGRRRSRRAASPTTCRSSPRRCSSRSSTGRQRRRPPRPASCRPGRRRG